LLVIVFVDIVVIDIVVIDIVIGTVGEHRGSIKKFNPGGHLGNNLLQHPAYLGACPF
jgi:hypothetical protein